MRKNKNNNNNRNKGPRIPSDKMILYRQLHEVDWREVAAAIVFTDSADTGYDLYTSIAGTADYTNMVAEYGELQYCRVEFNYSNFITSGNAVTVNIANGMFGVRQGIFDTTVTVKNAFAVTALPGSITICNNRKFNYITDIVMKNFVASSTTNLITTNVPKVNFYGGWFTAASGAITNLGYIAIRVLFKCKSKII